MVEIKTRQAEIELGPQDLTPHNIQYFCHHTQEFEHTQVEKAKKFLEHNCLEYTGEGFFICKPIEGYNTRTYTLRKDKDGEFQCNCQFGRKGDGCSHRLALYYAFKINYFKK